MGYHVDLDKGIVCVEEIYHGSLQGAALLGRAIRGFQNSLTPVAHKGSFDMFGDLFGSWRLNPCCSDSGPRIHDLVF